jgi:hypothetical protein
MNISRSLAALLAATLCYAPTSEAIIPDFGPPTIFFLSAQLPAGQPGVVTHWSLARFDDFSFTQNLR